MVLLDPFGAPTPFSIGQCAVLNTFYFALYVCIIFFETATHVRTFVSLGHNGQKALFNQNIVEVFGVQIAHLQKI